MPNWHCAHPDWIVQPSRNRYLYHCRSCSVVISYDMNVDTWRISHDPNEGMLDRTIRSDAYAALDRWMTERETNYGHRIFVHPEPALP